MSHAIFFYLPLTGLWSRFFFLLLLFFKTVEEEWEDAVVSPISEQINPVLLSSH